MEMASVKNRKRVPYPGTPSTADGSGMVVWVDTHTAQAACSYPITPSTGMGQGYEAEVANGRQNLWGERLLFLEPESEHSSASACEGFAAAGGRVSNYTSGQGLILMKEVLYTIAGKHLPMVFHIGARALTAQSLNIHCGHDDIMGVADVGWGMLFAKNAQEVADLGLIARRVAEDTQTPFFNIQDGFLGTHTLESVVLPEPKLMERFVGPPSGKLRDLIDPGQGLMSGTVQNQDSYMKGKVAQRYFFDQVLPALQRAMEEFCELTGRRYDLIEAYRLDDAEYAIVAMGTMVETAMATADYLREHDGLAIGVLNLTTFRPFPGPQIVEALKGLKAFTVLERVDVPLAESNPLTTEIKAAFLDAVAGREGFARITSVPAIYSGVGGLGGRDVRPADFVAIAENMARPGGRPFFVVGIDHELAISSERNPDVRSPGAFSMRGHSVGGYGSVTTNRVIAAVAADLFGLKVQAYPRYGSEKKGLPTNYYLTLARDRVRTHCELEQVEFVPVNDVNAFHMGDPLAGLAEGGMVFLQTDRTSPEEVWADLPRRARETIRRKGIRVLALDTVRIAREVATRADLVQRMQGIVLLGVFLRATPFLEEMRVDREGLFQRVEKSLRRFFGRRGEAVIRDNLTCVRRGFEEVFEVPKELIMGRTAEAVAAR
jgi:pyruvate-ferredoxin/flavodoxin oxidoreductase